MNQAARKREIRGAWGVYGGNFTMIIEMMTIKLDKLSNTFDWPTHRRRNRLCDMETEDHF
jgi:hypothetical protein